MNTFYSRALLLLIFNAFFPLPINSIPVVCKIDKLLPKPVMFRVLLFTLAAQLVLKWTKSLLLNIVVVLDWLAWTLTSAHNLVFQLFMAMMMWRLWVVVYSIFLQVCEIGVQS